MVNDKYGAKGFDFLRDVHLGHLIRVEFQPRSLFRKRESETVEGLVHELRRKEVYILRPPFFQGRQVVKVPYRSIIDYELIS